MDQSLTFATQSILWLDLMTLLLAVFGESTNCQPTDIGTPSNDHSMESLYPAESDSSGSELLPRCAGGLSYEVKLRDKDLHRAQSPLLIEQELAGHLTTPRKNVSGSNQVKKIVNEAIEFYLNHMKKPDEETALVDSFTAMYSQFLSGLSASNAHDPPSASSSTSHIQKLCTMLHQLIEHFVKLFFSAFPLRRDFEYALELTLQFMKAACKQESWIVPSISVLTQVIIWTDNDLLPTETNSIREQVISCSLSIGPWVVEAANQLLEISMKRTKLDRNTPTFDLLESMSAQDLKASEVHLKMMSISVEDVPALFQPETARRMSIDEIRSAHRKVKENELPERGTPRKDTEILQRRPHVTRVPSLGLSAITRFAEEEQERLMRRQQGKHLEKKDETKEVKSKKRSQMGGLLRLMKKSLRDSSSDVATAVKNRKSFRDSSSDVPTAAKNKKSLRDSSSDVSTTVKNKKNHLKDSSNDVETTAKNKKSLLKDSSNAVGTTANNKKEKGKEKDKKQRNEPSKEVVSEHMTAEKPRPNKEETPASEVFARRAILEEGNAKESEEKRSTKMASKHEAEISGEPPLAVGLDLMQETITQLQKAEKVLRKKIKASKGQEEVLNTCQQQLERVRSTKHTIQNYCSSAPQASPFLAQIV